jgi:hypothetical protein
MLIVSIAAFIALPSPAKAWSWFYGWDSYAECMGYYAKNPPGETRSTWTLGGSHIEHYTPEQLCAHIKYEEDEKRRKQEEMTRVIVLSCRAASVTDAGLLWLIPLIQVAPSHLLLLSTRFEADTGGGTYSRRGVLSQECQPCSASVAPSAESAVAAT